VCTVYIAFRCLYLDFIPLWDGKSYYNVLEKIVHSQHNWMDYCISDHSSIFFFAWTGLVEQIFPHNIYVFNLVLILWGTLGVYAFCKILDIYQKTDLANDAELLIFGLIYAFHPAILAGSMNFNPDQGVLVCFILYWYACLQEKWSWATLFSLMMIFSKENGVLLLALPLLAGLNFTSKSGVLKWAKQRILPLLVPPIVFVFYLLYKRTLHPNNVFFHGTRMDLDFLITFLNPFHFTSISLTYFIEAYILNFGWIISGFLWIVAAHTFIKLAFSKNIPWKNLVIQGSFSNSLLMLVLSSYLLTRYQTYVNIRYLLGIFPFIILCAFQAIQSLSLTLSRRLAISGIFLLSQLIATTNSIDPISRMIFGTFDFGEHRMYTLNRLTHECCGLGRDQLVYNLEFTKIDELQAIAYADMKPSPNTVILVNPLTTYEYTGNLTTGPLCKNSYRRSLGGPESFNPNYRFVSDILSLAVKPYEVFYVAFPNFPPYEDLGTLRRVYQQFRQKTYQSNGYALKVFQFTNPRFSSS
jgi:hypothetical protein